jgi:citrate synthase
MAGKQYLTAQEAAETLSVSAPTLYAYVSRGLIRSEAIDGSKRARRYFREDVERLRERKELRRNPAIAAAKALHLGMPVLDSAIALITDGHLYYRGYDAVSLATMHSVEEVAALLWLGHLDADTATLFGATEQKLPSRCFAMQRRLSELMTDLAPIERLQLVLPMAATEDVAAYDLQPHAVAHTGARILRLLALIAVGRGKSERDLVGTLQEGWGLQNPESASLLRTALVLCADHELNVSAFTARCVASANSTPYAVVMAGLAALQGAKHGGYTDQVEAFLSEVATPERASTAITHRLKRGERLPGFGHQLYPEGDPRAQALLALATKAYPKAPAIVLGKAVATQVQRTIGQQPTIDFALAILASALHLPSGSALALFALGRTIGWIGHAIEQYQLDQLIRPRARYIGPAPFSDDQRMQFRRAE